MTAVLKHKVSHGATMLFIQVDCPMCTEDQVVGPPNVTLACGHVLCRQDFINIGGHVGQAAVDLFVAPTAEEDDHPTPQLLPGTEEEEDDNHEDDNHHQPGTQEDEDDVVEWRHVFPGTEENSNHHLLPGTEENSNVTVMSVENHILVHLSLAQLFGRN
jgi:hypothetical protein